MPEIIFEQTDGTRRSVHAETGRNVMKVATENLVDGIVGECGGDLSCATCHVFVDERWTSSLAPIEPDEEAMLAVTSEEPTENSRLCCQIVVQDDLDGLVLHVPETQR
jgi:2Fe-2S ferredoxin